MPGPAGEKSHLDRVDPTALWRAPAVAATIALGMFGRYHRGLCFGYMYPKELQHFQQLRLYWAVALWLIPLRSGYITNSVSLFYQFGLNFFLLFDQFDMSLLKGFVKYPTMDAY